MIFEYITKARQKLTYELMYFTWISIPAICPMPTMPFEKEGGNA